MTTAPLFPGMVHTVLVENDGQVGNPRAPRDGGAMIPTVRVVESVDDLARAGAAEFLECARDAQQARGRFVVALSGGSTPRRLYELLAREPFRRQIPWASGSKAWMIQL